MPWTRAGRENRQGRGLLGQSVASRDQPRGQPNVVALRAAAGMRNAELDEQRHRIDVARTALEHGLKCPSDDPMQCPRFRSIIEGRRRGLSLEESHEQAH